MVVEAVVVAVIFYSHLRKRFIGLTLYISNKTDLLTSAVTTALGFAHRVNDTVDVAVRHCTVSMTLLTLL